MADHRKALTNKKCKGIIQQDAPFAFFYFLVIIKYIVINSIEFLGCSLKEAVTAGD